MRNLVKILWGWRNLTTRACETVGPSFTLAYVIVVASVPYPHNVGYENLLWIGLGLLSLAAAIHIVDISLEEREAKRQPSPPRAAAQ